MQRRVFWALALTMLGLSGASQSTAATVYLTYTGNQIPLITPPTGFDPAFFPAFSGRVVLDENQLGGNISNRTLVFSTVGGSSPQPGDETDGILEWTLGLPLYSAEGTTASFSFGPKRQVQSWRIDAPDGPPDYLSTNTGPLIGDYVYAGVGVEYLTDVGSWTTTIPLPSSGILLVGGIVGLLGTVGRARRVRN